jgi:hypothetical protein
VNMTYTMKLFHTQTDIGVAERERTVWDGKYTVAPLFFFACVCECKCECKCECVCVLPVNLTWIIEPFPHTDGGVAEREECKGWKIYSCSILCVCVCVYECICKCECGCLLEMELATSESDLDH